MTGTTPDHGCIGSSFEAFLKDEDIFEECEAEAIKRVIAWQVRTYMEEKQASKTAVAKLLGSSRSFVDRLLDEKDASITLTTILKVAKLVGKPLHLQFGDADPACHA